MSISACSGIHGAAHPSPLWLAAQRPSGPWNQSRVTIQLGSQSAPNRQSKKKGTEFTRLAKLNTSIQRITKPISDSMDDVPTKKPENSPITALIPPLDRTGVKFESPPGGSQKCHFATPGTEASPNRSAY